MSTFRIVTQYKAIYKGNQQIGYWTDDNDVFVYKHGSAIKIGNVDHPSEIVKMVSAHVAATR